MLKLSTFAPLVFAAVVAAGAPQLGAQGDRAQPAAAHSAIPIPEVLRIEHAQLLRDLEHAKAAGGHTTDVAHEVEEALARHFEEETRLVMPLLGLLAPLAKGEVTEQMRPAVWMAQQVRDKLPQYMEEHRRINEAVNRLISVAGREKKPEVAQFGQRLALRIQHAEAVLYPAAIVVGQGVEEALAHASAGR